MKGSEAQRPESVVVPVKPRRVVSEAERDDLKQAITIVLASVQRERARADQFYVRSRNLLAYSTAVFTAIQAAFLANLGRRNGSVPIMSTAETHHIAVAAGISLGFLLIAVLFLVGFADRARGVSVVTGEAVSTSYYDLDHEHQNAGVLEVLLAKLVAEDRSWATTNLVRKRLAGYMALFTAASAVAALTELVLIYGALSS